MDYDTTNEGMNKTFAARLNVEVEQENIKTDKSEISLDINDNTKTLGLEDKIENYEIESSDEEVAEIDSLGNIVGKHYGTVVFKVRNKITGAKKDITVTITKKLKVTFVKQAGVDKISKNEETCLLKEKEEKSCSITLPEITPEQGYTKVGWSTDKNATVKLETLKIENSDIKLYSIYVKEVYEFDYTGSEQVFTVPVDGTYKIETWGAQGGSVEKNSFSESLYGGYGAYSNGKIKINSKDKLYINVGGSGKACLTYGNTTSGTITCGNDGGYNGGGNTRQYISNTYYGSGGGATHVAKISRLLKTLDSSIQSILIVSAGGGGATRWIP